LAYIGNIPAESYASFETETFSVSATTNYTLSHAVTNENEIRLVINGVVQQPGSGKAYTASNTTLTLTSATQSGDSMYAVYLGRALQTVNPPNASVGTAQLADSSVTSAKLASGAVANTPAFYVVRGSNQTISSASTTKIQFDTEIFDTAGAYDNSSNYRFTVPSGQAGKYYFFTKLNFETTSGDDIIFVAGGFYKNGSIQNWGVTNTSGGTAETFRQYLYNNSIMLDLSVGDYVEVYGNAIGSNLALESNGSGYYETSFGGYKIIE